MNLSTISSDWGVRDQYDTAKFKFLERDSAQHDSLTMQKPSEVIVKLNLASGCDMKPVVDILVKSGWSHCNWNLTHPYSQDLSDGYDLGWTEGNMGQACGRIHMSNDIGPISRSEPVASYNEILTPVTLNTLITSG